MIYQLNSRFDPFLVSLGIFPVIGENFTVNFSSVILLLHILDKTEPMPFSPEEGYLRIFYSGEKSDLLRS